jgi:hypothetical protein
MQIFWKPNFVSACVGAIFVCVGVLILVSACTTSRALKGPPPESVRISDVVEAIQRAIDPFWQSSPNGLPPIASVKIALQAVRDDRLSAEADYLVVALKGYYDNAFTQEIDLTLTPRKSAQENAEEFGPSIETRLRDAIASAQKQIAATYHHGDHVLGTQEIDVQLAFAVTWDANAGVNKWAILPISLTASNDLSIKTTNTITVAFKTPTAP